MNQLKEEMPCKEERKASLKCSENHHTSEDKKQHCQDFFDQYKECKQKYVEERNARNAGPDAQKPKLPWSQ
jgi:hypothetical protein